MALARARAFQEAKAKEEQQKNIEKIFKVTIVKPGDAGNNGTELDYDDWSINLLMFTCLVNFPKEGDQVAMWALRYICLFDGLMFVS